jgi:hypothetical protein
MIWIIGAALACWMVISIILVAVHSWRTAAALDKAREIYASSRQCDHKFFTLGQTGVPGVITLTTKWCKVCGKNLGPAKLVKGKWV